MSAAPVAGCLGAALEYERRGLSVIALHGIRPEGGCTCGNAKCASPGKHPIGKWQHRQHTRASAAELRDVFSRHSNANVGIVTGAVSGVLVLDVDGPEGHASLAGLEGIAELRPPLAATGRGLHIYLAHPGGTLGNFARRLPALDGRADGGCVVAPPSMHASGSRYAWRSGYELGQRELPAAPQAVIDLFKPVGDLPLGGAASRAAVPAKGAPARSEGAPEPAAQRENTPPHHDGPAHEVASGTAYGLAALDDECRAVRAAPIGEQEKTLNEAALKMGRLVASGDLEARQAERALRDAGLGMANAADREPWSYEAVASKVRRGIEDGARSGPRAARQAPNEGSCASIGGAAADDWPEPADILETEAEALPSFPLDFLPGAARAYVEDAADRAQVPPDGVAAALLVGAGAAIGAGFHLAPKQHDPWRERPCLWAMVIGEPGSNKSHAIGTGIAPLRQVERALQDTHQEALRAHGEALARHETDSLQWRHAASEALKAGAPAPSKPTRPEPPAERRIIIGDITQEKLVELMRDNARGLVRVEDELAAWFQSFNQYRPGSDRQFYLKCHAGEAHSQDRKGAGSVHLRRPFLAMVGGIQPGALERALRGERARIGGDGATDDGMTARFGLLLWPDRIASPRFVDRAPDADAELAVNSALAQLAEMQPHSILGFAPEAAFRFAPDAQAIFQAWWEGLHARQGGAGGRPGGQRSSPAAQAHAAKYPGLFARLATVRHMLASTLRGDRPATLVDAETAEAVRDLVDRYLWPHAQKVYRHLGADPARSGARVIADWIKRDRPSGLTVRDVRRKGWAGLTREDDAVAALDHLENVLGWIRGQAVNPGPRGGRSTHRYAVNPRVFA